ncbi:MAG: TonB-dependent receptor [Bacteroidota bacterium]
MRVICVLVLFILVLGSPLRVAAQDRYHVKGQVVDAQSNNPLPGVQVIMESTGYGEVTGADGRFQIEAVRRGAYTLVARLIGFGTHEQTIIVSEASLDLGEIRLTEQPIDLGEVVAQADYAFSTASSSALRAFDLLTRPTDSAQDLLRLVPGLITAQHAGGGKAEQIFMRGFDADHGTDVALTIDGMPINMVSHGHGQGYADLHFIIPEVVQRVDVHKGPYRADQGNLATAGSVHYTTRDHLEHSLVRVEGGNFGTSEVTALLQLPSPTAHQGAYLAGQFYRTDGPVDVPQGLNRFNLFGKVHRHLNASTEVALTASSFSSAWDASGQIPQRAVDQGLIGRFGTLDPLEGGATTRHAIGVAYETHTEGHDLDLNAYAGQYRFKLFSNFTYFLDNEEGGDMIEQTDDRMFYGLHGRYRVQQPLGTMYSTTTLGGGVRADDINATLWESPQRVRGQALVDADMTERNLFLWGQEELIVRPWLRVQAGLRADYFTFDVDDQLEGVSDVRPRASGFAQQVIVNPKASVVVSPMPSLDVFVNGGSGFHSNDARNVVQQARREELARTQQQVPPSQRLSPTDVNDEETFYGTLPRAVGGEVGLRKQFGPRAMLSAAVWQLDLESEYVYVGDGGFTELNGPSRRYGLDLEGRVALTPWLSADADVNLANGRLRDAPAGEDHIALSPRVTSTGGLSVRHPQGFTAGLRYIHIGDRPANESGSVTAEGYTILNAVAALQVGTVEVSLALENLLDVAWNEAQFDTESRLRGEAAPVSELHFTPGTPRHIRLGIGYRF